MKKIYSAVLLLLFILAIPLSALSQTEEPTIYIIKKGDTLWGLSDQFLKDPHYWPDLWAQNQKITNPHLIYPGQKLKVFSDRIEIEEAPAPVAAQSTAPRVTRKEVAAVKTFRVNGGEGFLLEKELQPAGHIIATEHDRLLVGEEDVVYTDIGKLYGAKTGDTFSIFQKMNTVKDPATNDFIGWRVASLGTLNLVELKAKNSKALITQSYSEIGPGAYLMPYRERRREVALKAASNYLRGYIVESRDGNITIGSGDCAYVNLGKSSGLKIGNLLYIVRPVQPENFKACGNVGELPMNVIGAMVVVEIGEKTSTGLIVKSTEAIYRGDKVELIRN
jgi:LysM repeat protein